MNKLRLLRDPLMLVVFFGLSMRAWAYFGPGTVKVDSGFETGLLLFAFLALTGVALMRGLRLLRSK